MPSIKKAMNLINLVRESNITNPQISLHCLSKPNKKKFYKTTFATKRKAHRKPNYFETRRFNYRLLTLQISFRVSSSFASTGNGVKMADSTSSGSRYLWPR
ncbi:hypothetical protein O6P43_020886 [Quillaja saponaria]|uniref:Uncharacterized protein n=1 Tax=Quillaja saponaria TaxID=32244 RepID=A0AAD7PLR2_QUISA|nr:hypothetical protein O6P43_020886 [Quillaja saponaria]